MTIWGENQTTAELAELLRAAEVSAEDAYGNSVCVRYHRARGNYLLRFESFIMLAMAEHGLEARSWYGEKVSGPDDPSSDQRDPESVFFIEGPGHARWPREKGGR